jgi:uncharacterized RmlC-like cupin family protein
MKSKSVQRVMVLRQEESTLARQGVPQFFGISADSVRATGLTMNLTAFPPGGSSQAHSHRGYETAIYAITGRVAFFYGNRLENQLTLEPGDFCFIPPDVPHKAYNLSRTETAVSVTARNDPREQENVVLTPEADDGSSEKIVERRRSDG